MTGAVVGLGKSGEADGRGGLVDQEGAGDAAGVIRIGDDRGNGVGACEAGDRRGCVVGGGQEEVVGKKSVPLSGTGQTKIREDNEQLVDKIPTNY